VLQTEKENLEHNLKDEKWAKVRNGGREGGREGGRGGVKTEKKRREGGKVVYTSSREKLFADCYISAFLYFERSQLTTPPSSLPPFLPSLGGGHEAGGQGEGRRPTQGRNFCTHPVEW